MYETVHNLTDKGLKCLFKCTLMDWRNGSTVIHNSQAAKQKLCTVFYIYIYIYSYKSLPRYNKIWRMGTIRSPGDCSVVVSPGNNSHFLLAVQGVTDGHKVHLLNLNLKFQRRQSCGPSLFNSFVC